MPQMFPMNWWLLSLLPLTLTMLNLINMTFNKSLSSEKHLSKKNIKKTLNWKW
uniref:ATP synthase subunit 8 n=1 Tax=Phalangium opilio TaxID=118624 RepID=B2CKY6_PHAOP|nr:ATP synthase F0 subunit 8 [Phalangium opilio]ACA66081.1 ATP synthase subunit 8 [Phalangium opilio]